MALLPLAICTTLLLGIYALPASAIDDTTRSSVPRYLSGPGGAFLATPSAPQRRSLLSSCGVGYSFDIHATNQRAGGASWCTSLSRSCDWAGRFTLNSDCSYTVRGSNCKCTGDYEPNIPGGSWTLGTCEYLSGLGTLLGPVKGESIGASGTGKARFDGKTFPVTWTSLGGRCKIVHEFVYRGASGDATGSDWITDTTEGTTDTEGGTDGTVTETGSDGFTTDPAEEFPTGKTGDGGWDGGSDRGWGGDEEVTPKSKSEVCNLKLLAAFYVRSKPCSSAKTLGVAKAGKSFKGARKVESTCDEGLWAMVKSADGEKGYLHVSKAPDKVESSCKSSKKGDTPI